MTINEFITVIESYYGLQYENDVERKMLKSYLSKKTGEDIERLASMVVVQHSKRWKTLPDISIINEIENSMNSNDAATRAERSWLELLHVSSLHNKLIVDPVAYFVVSGYGSWARFCEARDGEYKELTHKDYVKRYMAAFNMGLNITPRLLIGEYHEKFGPDFIGVKNEIIGDQEQGRALLESRSKAALPDEARAAIEHMTVGI